MDQELRGDLLKVLQSFYPERPEFGTWDYLHVLGDPKSALLYIHLFCPEFTEVDGSVLLQSDDVEDSFRESRRINPISLEEAERIFNTQEIPCLYSFDPAQELYGVLGRAVAEACRIRLGYLYPERSFVVTIEPMDYGSGPEAPVVEDEDKELIVTFFEKR